MWRSRGVVTLTLNPRVEVSSQFHVPADLLPGKEAMVPIEQEVESNPQWGGTLWKTEKKPFSLPGIKLRFPDYPALSVIIIPTMLKVIFKITSDK